MEDSTEKLIEHVEHSLSVRRSRLMWSCSAVTLISIVFIWTVQMPSWLSEVRPAVYLTLIALNFVISINLEVIPRNERKLLEELKRVAGHQSGNADLAEST